MKLWLSVSHYKHFFHDHSITYSTDNSPTANKVTTHTTFHTYGPPFLVST